MIELTEAQCQELRNTVGPEIRVSDPDTRQEYVLVPAQVYERLKHLVYDTGDWTPEEQLRLMADSGKRAGWDDPAMDVYDNYDENHTKLCP